MKNFLKLLRYFSISLLTSCSSIPPFKTDEEITHENIQKVISAINNNDKSSFVNLFAYEARNTNEFDDNVDRFFSLFSESINEWDDGGTKTVNDKDENYESKFQEMSYRLIGNAEVWDIAIKWCIYWTPDTKEETKMGIWSLYAINEKDNPLPQYSYRGDGNWTLGIHIGVLLLPEDNKT